MEIYERIRDLRKNYLKLSQTALGEKLGVNRDVIKNIELNALARPEQKLPLIRLMCKEFGLNENYILYGTEPKFAELDAFSLDKFAKIRGATDLELQIMKKYFELDPEVRQMLVNHFIGEQPAAVQDEMTREEIENIQVDVNKLEELSEDDGNIKKRVV